MVKNYKRLLVATLVFLAYAILTIIIKNKIMLGILFWGIFGFLFLILQNKSVLQSVTIEDMKLREKLIVSAFAFLMILLCVLPMGLAPFWNGKIPMHRNQYELLADSILEGHLYIDYDDIDPKLLAMEDPYDYEARLRDQVIVHYDHAFYNGHYYMYFGVVPVFLLFIPFKLIFGRSLVTFHATQFFVMMSIIAFFLLFYLLAKKYFSKMPLGTYIISTIAIILATIGYFTQAPALYCTAISGGVCLMLYSILFYFFGVFYAKKEGLQVLFAVLGAISGALAFGCRPPAAVANIVAIPIAIYYAKHYEGKHIVRNFIFVAIPYAVIGSLLMAYNYLRFETPFEFGQAYQLTGANQANYSDFFARVNVWNAIAGIFENFFATFPLEKEFPHFTLHPGFFITYPVMWLVLLYFAQDSLRKELKKDKTFLLALILLIDAVIVTVLDVQWAPGLCERYRLDAYYVLGILLFILIGYRLKTTEKPAVTQTVVLLFSLASIYVAFLIFMIPFDANFAYAFPEKAEVIKNIVTFR